MSAQINPRVRGSVVRVPRTAEVVASRIRRQIIRGELNEGDVLPHEAVLMAKFEIARPTLREALRVLEAEGLIRARRGAPARVQVPSEDAAAHSAGLVLQYRGVTLADVLEARLVVELPAARAVAQRRDHRECAGGLKEILDSIDTSREPERFGEFNARLVEMAGNSTLFLITNMLEYVYRAGALRVIRTRQPEDERLNQRGYQARARLIERISAGDADGAEATWRKHLSETNRVVGAGTALVVDLFD